MFQSKFSCVMALSAVLLLGACAAQQQNSPAPVVSSVENGSNGVYNPYTATNPYVAPADTSVAGGVYTNPYGAAPYTPPAAGGTVYQPPVDTTAVQNTAAGLVGRVNGQYIGNYSAVDINAVTHKVSPGDTVFNIAKRYGISQDSLRAWNNLPADNTINLGQVLRVKPVGGTNTAVVSKPQPTVKPTYTPPAVSNASIVWTAPTYGNIVRQFGGANKGVDIGGSRGQPVVAAADGQVVYSGSNLRGYGNLIILQHNQTYLTAYGHNDSLMVREGQMVKRGQQIARMGSSDSSNGVKLHFEVRENGTPVNPTRFVRF